MQNELKPCPFCGSVDITWERGDYRRSTSYMCEDCGCSLETGETWQAPAAWNTRTPANGEGLVVKITEAAIMYLDADEDDTAKLEAFAKAIEPQLAALRSPDKLVEAYETAAKVADYGVERAKRDWRNPIAQEAVAQVCGEIAEVIRDYKTRAALGEE